MSRRMFVSAAVVSVCLVTVALCAVQTWSRHEATRKNAESFHTCLIDYLLEQRNLRRLVVIKGEDDRPTVSWRLHALQSIRPIPREGSDLRKPWTDAANRLFREMAPDIFCFRGTSSASIMAIDGKNSAFEKEDLEISTLRDDILLVVEVAQKDINWIQPFDLDLADFTVGNKPRHGILPSSDNPKGVLVGFADGSVWRVPQAMLLARLAEFANVNTTPTVTREAAFGDRMVFGPRPKERTGREVWGRTPIGDGESPE